MAESEDCRVRRLKHQQHMSRVFDEVMGLGEFAESSRGSTASSKSGSPGEAKGGTDQMSTQEEQQPMEAEDSNHSRQEEKMDEGTGESSFFHVDSPSPEKPSSFTMGASNGGGGGSGAVAFDDALDGLPTDGQEEEEEDWHFALPMGTMDEVDIRKAGKKSGPPEQESSQDKAEPSTSEPKGDEKEEEEEDEAEEQVQDQDKEGSNESANTSHSSQESSRDEGVLNQVEETEDCQQGEAEKSTPAPVEDRNPQPPPTVNIKEEPIDEGYDAALLPQNSVRQIKEELDHQEEELRISSVYSVGGGNSFAAPPATPAPAVAPTPTPTAIFIPGRGAVLQAMASLPTIRPPPQVQSLSALTQLPPRPPQPPLPGSVRCSGCSKVLLKGQTAFQRKGSTQLFCSTVCLTGHLPPVPKNRSCFQCNREIIQPRDMVTIIGDDGSITMHFCGQFCLSVFRQKKKTTDKLPEKWAEKRMERKVEKPPEKPAEHPDRPFCSVCKVANKPIEHEVTHQGRLHRLCSNACFVTWRKIRSLALNCCEGCGLYCNSKSGSCQTLMIDRSPLNFCGSTCVSTYKQACRKTTECAHCHKTVVVSTTVMDRDQKGKVQLYCSLVCVEQSRPIQHGLKGTPFPCSLCKTTAVPQYHLAMVDGTIRNFCSYNCVSIFRKSGHASQPELTNGTSSVRDPALRDAPKQGLSAGASSVPPTPQDYPSSVPYHHPSHSSVPPLVPPHPAISSPSVPAQGQVGQPLKPAESRSGDSSRLTCHQCSKQFTSKPLLFCHQGRISMFCSKTCCEQYKTQKNVQAMCEWCKQENILFDTISYNHHDIFFCSENCKLLFRHDLTTRNKDHSWRPCTYCSGVAQKMLHSHYGGKIEEFCKPHCMSQFTVLYYGMSRCDNCRKQGYMTEKLQCLGSVRNFCNMACLQDYCFLHFEKSQHTSSNGTGTAPHMPNAPTQPHHSSKMNPVIADVVSLASGAASQPSVSADAALSGALPATSVDGKNLDHASTQTDAMRVPSSRRRQMKNKSVLCRPFTTDQEITCQLPLSCGESGALLDSSSQTNWPSVDAFTSPPSTSPQHQLCDGVPARLTGRHFLGERGTASDCKVCSQHKRKNVVEEEQKVKKQKTEEEEEENSVEEEEDKGMMCLEEEQEDSEKKDGGPLSKKTLYYCKTCSGEPSLCPVPCFELYHTQLIYRALLHDNEEEEEKEVKEEKVKVLMVPVPVPVFIPVPMNMYSQHMPVPMPMTMPVPVPFMVPPQTKEVKDASVQSEMVEEEKQKDESVSSADQSSSYTEDETSSVVTPAVCELEETSTAAQPDPPSTASPKRTSESVDVEAETSKMASDTPTSSVDDHPPSSPMMDLEADFPCESLDQKSSTPQRGVKRSRDSHSSSRKRSRRRVSSMDRTAVSTLNHIYGVKAWSSWVQQRSRQPPKFNPVEVKEDILQCNSSELSLALSLFIREVRRPNGEEYSPDSIFYLCLGIQQYLFTKGRIENIFNDELYSQFAAEMSAMLRIWKPKLLPSGDVIPSRVEESYLWECKQLGAYSPIVLLNTLLFFCTKNFHLTTVEQHQRLTFSNFTRHFKPCNRAGKVYYLRLERGSDWKEIDWLRQHQTENESELEMVENIANPLQCPVRLYEFYLSRCPDSAKKRGDLFYLQPEERVHTHRQEESSRSTTDLATVESTEILCFFRQEVNDRFTPNWTLRHYLQRCRPKIC
ncbi:zinc finger MYM-type protein 4-like [Pholidichthys leucotaenia]